MTAPNVDTFEHDIANEIIQKEATLGDIASATGDIGNAGSEGKSAGLIIGISIIVVLGLIAVLIGVYFYYTKSAQPLPSTATTSLDPVVDPGLPVATLSQTLDQNIGRFVSHVNQTSYGYSMTIASYSSVFAYMNGHEREYADEIAQAVGSGRDMSTTTPVFAFTDATIDNQNMRIGTSGSSTVVYAFANTQLLLIASSTQGIIGLRNAILK